MLAARALGYGSVCITDAIPEEATQKAFNIPERYNRVCITPIGIPVEWPTKEKKLLRPFLLRRPFKAYVCKRLGVLSNKGGPHLLSFMNYHFFSPIINTHGFCPEP